MDADIPLTGIYSIDIPDDEHPEIPDDLKQEVHIATIRAFWEWQTRKYREEHPDEYGAQTRLTKIDVASASISLRADGTATLYLTNKDGNCVACDISSPDTFLLLEGFVDEENQEQSQKESNDGNDQEKT